MLSQVAATAVLPCALVMLVVLVMLHFVQLFCWLVRKTPSPISPERPWIENYRLAYREFQPRPQPQPQPAAPCFDFLVPANSDPKMVKTASPAQTTEVAVSPSLSMDSGRELARLLHTFLATKEDIFPASIFADKVQNLAHSGRIDLNANVSGCALTPLALLASCGQTYGDVERAQLGWKILTVSGADEQQRGYMGLTAARMRAKLWRK